MAGSGQVRRIQLLEARRDPDDAGELVFEASSGTPSLAKYSNAHHAHNDPAPPPPAASKERDRVELSWICDPAARRKTAKTSFLKISSYEDEELRVTLNVTLLQDTVRSSTLSIAYATSPEDLERILAERKRGNVRKQPVNLPWH